ncbi:MAG: ATP-binding cassette domain-containing protein [Proteobacteria bacterium]|nr:ATP-binding cassette domain-containing protein [Pseudomonadota bacterium]
MPLIRVQDLVKEYSLPRKFIFQKPPVFRALHGINLSIEKGESYGIVGESGCGKSTLARIVMALDSPTSGTVFYNENDLFSVSQEKLRKLRKHFQMVFQDPYSSLNPRKKVLSIVSEPLDTLEKSISSSDRKDRVISMLAEVGLSKNDLEKYPHEFSGGQRQRIAIARALITKPSLIVADESVSALDVSVQAQVLNLMMDLQEKYDLAFLFISHDLSVVEFVTQRLAVIYLGRIVEQGLTGEIFEKPFHPYTQLLLSAIPSVDPEMKNQAEKTVHSGYILEPNSCPFVDRCSLATEICVQQAPELLEKAGHFVACHHATFD